MHTFLDVQKLRGSRQYEILETLKNGVKFVNKRLKTINEGLPSPCTCACKACKVGWFDDKFKGGGAQFSITPCSSWHVRCRVFGKL